MTAACPGFASYQNLSNGQVTVNGQLLVVTRQEKLSALEEAWGNYGAAIVRASSKHGVPVPWLVGVMMAESKGNPYACSPCSACDPKLCTTGAGLRCCAFGLMQFIAPTAAKYGATPGQLIQSPELAIDIAARFMLDLSDTVGFDLVRIASAYNGGLGKCGKTDSTFGWHNNGDYPRVVVEYANTFVEMGFRTPAVAMSATGAFFATLGLGIAAGIYTGKLRIPWR